ncbi:hypothetical protein AB1E18_012804 [Capra hircus]
MLLLLLQRIQNGAAAAFWAYIPDPPTIQSLGWDKEVVPVYVNDTSLLGGKSDIHISPQQANISFYGLTTQYPMCFSYQSQHPHCIQVSADISYPRVTISGIDEKTGKRSYRDGTGPLDIPFCNKHLSIGIGIDTPWTLCRARVASVYNINNADATLLWDWAPGGTPDFPENRGQHPPIFSVNTAQVYQTELWKLLAAFGHGNSLYLQSNISGSKYVTPVSPRDSTGAAAPARQRGGGTAGGSERGPGWGSRAETEEEERGRRKEDRLEPERLHLPRRAEARFLTRRLAAPGPECPPQLGGAPASPSALMLRETAGPGRRQRRRSVGLWLLRPSADGAGS